jgi:PKD repeat protein
MFDASGSSDPDGIINSYTWFFGDGSVSYGGSMASHTYAAAGSYEIRLIVKDNLGVATEATRTVTVVPPAMHIGDLDGTRTIQQNTWTALVTIRVHDMAHGPVGNATVSGSWSFGGTSSCTTDSTGRCLVSKSAIPNGTKVTFTIVNVTKPVSVYSSVDNHDPDADSNGTSIMVKRQ